jgi:UDP-N-acetyl-D-mannosaminuronate dehydrogenase
VADKVVIVAGLGEVGAPLCHILKRTYNCVGVDVTPIELTDPCSVLHVCYPSQLHDFVGVTVAYTEKYRPEQVIVDSTVPIGTTRMVQERVSCPVVFSPVRGKHVKMEEDLLRYKKFVAGFTPEATKKAAEHFLQAGFQVGTFPNPEAGELSKLIETTWLGMLVGWAQEVERIAARYDSSYDDVNGFIEEIDFLPSHIFPGVIGGHCVLPNIAILRSSVSSKFLDAIVESNNEKLGRTRASALDGACHESVAFGASHGSPE